MPGIPKRESRHGSEVGMRIKFDPEDDRIAGIPSTLRTRSIE
jgi:hypothetical protein